MVPRHPPCALSSLSPQRCSRPLCSSQGTDGAAGQHWLAMRPSRWAAPDSSGPNSVSDRHLSISPRFQSRQDALARRTGEVIEKRRPSSRRSTYRSSARPETSARGRAPDAGQTGALCSLSGVLLRKEVIQPHLPVRLPCYDLVPIASPTFDGSLPCGLGHRLRVLPTFVT